MVMAPAPRSTEAVLLYLYLQHDSGLPGNRRVQSSAAGQHAACEFNVPFQLCRTLSLSTCSHLFCNIKSTLVRGNHAWQTRTISQAGHTRHFPAHHLTAKSWRRCRFLSSWPSFGTTDPPATSKSQAPTSNLDVGLTGAVSNRSSSLWMRWMGSIVLYAVDRQIDRRYEAGDRA